MKGLLILGVDGVSWEVLSGNRDRLPAWREIGEIHRLHCDVSPVHSAPCWTTAFTGLLVEEHGVRDFVSPGDRDSVAALPWVWKEFLGLNPTVLGLPVALPPVNYGVPMEVILALGRGWIQTTLSVTKPEMLGTNEVMQAVTLAEMAGSVDRLASRLIVSIFPAADRAGHILWGTDDMLDVYDDLGRRVTELVQIAQNRDWGWLVFSDHGMCAADDPASVDPIGARDGRRGGHATDGIIAGSPIPTSNGLPRFLSNVAAWIRMLATYIEVLHA